MNPEGWDAEQTLDAAWNCLERWLETSDEIWLVVVRTWLRLASELILAEEREAS